MSFSNIRVFSDGTPNGLRVTTESGDDVPVEAVHFTQNVGEPPRVTLVLQGVRVDLDPDATRRDEQRRLYAEQERVFVKEADHRLDVV